MAALPRLLVGLRLLAGLVHGRPSSSYHGGTCPCQHLVGLIEETLGRAPVSADLPDPPLGLVAEGLHALSLVCRTVAVIHLEVERIAQNEPEDHAVAVDPGAAEHAPKRDPPERLQLLLQ